MTTKGKEQDEDSTHNIQRTESRHHSRKPRIEVLSYLQQKNHPFFPAIFCIGWTSAKGLPLGLAVYLQWMLRLNASGAIPGGQIDMRPWDGGRPKSGPATVLAAVAIKVAVFGLAQVVILEFGFVLVLILGSVLVLVLLWSCLSIGMLKSVRSAQTPLLGFRV